MKKAAGDAGGLFAFYLGMIFPEAFYATSTLELVCRDTVDRPVEVLRISPEASPSRCSVCPTVLSNSAT